MWVLVPRVCNLCDVSLSSHRDCTSVRCSSIGDTMKEHAKLLLGSTVFVAWILYMVAFAELMARATEFLNSIPVIGWLF